MIQHEFGLSDIHTKKIANAAIVILGASGDLAKRKLIPALYALFGKGDIKNSSIIVGSGRSDFTSQTFRSRFDVSFEFSQMLFYHKGMVGLKRFLADKGSFEQVVFFMALPPKAYSLAAQQLSHEGFGEESRIIIEKPFGYDYKSSHELNINLTKDFKESQIYRIDHYLAKEAVQNILVFRFANVMFRPLWNNRYIDSIQINAYETIGIENRGAYFDKAGIIRDMVQNHLTQLLCLLMMEEPVSLSAEEIKYQKMSILKALSIEYCCRYQYRGYHEEKDVASGSMTETCAELKLFITNYRWAGVPIYIRTGKYLTRKGTEIGITFKAIPNILFNAKGNLQKNKIIFKIQPSAGIIVDISNKIPGGNLEITNTNMAFCYRDSFHSDIPEAYQKLLLDALMGDKTLFVSAEETEIAWKKFESFIDTGDLQYYEKGTVPEFCLNKEWIDFDKYISICD